MNVVLRNWLARLSILANQRRLRSAAYVVLGLLATLIVAAWLAVPVLIRWGLETKASAALGRQITVEKIAFNPFNLSARIESLQIAGAEGKRALLSIKRMQANLSWLSVWYRGPVLDSLRIEQPAIHFSRTGEDRYSFSDIIARMNEPSDPSSPKNPLRFSVNNIELLGGQVFFEDLPVGKNHRIEGIQLGVPFISNLPTRVQLAVVPHLEAKINGATLRLDGQIKPFASSHEASLDVLLAPFDLTQYLGYAPTHLPVRLDRGELGCQIHLVWGQGPKGGQRFAINGHIGLSKLDLRDADGAPLFGLEALGLDIANLEPLATPFRASISRLQIEAPEVHLSRAEDGQLNIGRLLASKTDDSAAHAPKPAISIMALDVAKGRLDWQDHAVKGGYALSLQPIELSVRGLDLAADKAANVALRAHGEGATSLSFNGEVNLSRGVHRGHLTVDGIKVEELLPYYQSFVGQAQIQGVFAAETDLLVEAADAVQIKLAQARCSLHKLGLWSPGVRKPLVEIPEIKLEGLAFDLAHREIRLEKFSASGVRWAVAKGENGQINVLSVLKPPTAATQDGGSASEDKATATNVAPETAWSLQVDDARLAAWELHFEDRSGSAPVSLDLRDFGLHLVDWRNAVGHRAGVELVTRVNKIGRITLAGKVASDPLQGALRADIRDVDLLAIQPYVDQHFKILVTRGRLSSKGSIDFDLAKPKRPGFRFQGNLAINEFSSLDRVNDADFLQWRHLGLADAAFQLDPMSISAKELRIEDFYSRLILDAQGRFNLRELAAENGQDEEADKAKTAPIAQSSTDAMPKIRLDKLLLVGGSINYSDRFVKPNYDAKLAAVNGVLSDLSSDPNTVAQLDLKAAVDGAAPVVVTGQLNPLRQDRFLDINAQVTGIDLTSVSTYAAKYVGYGIAKGKLSMNLKYQIRDRKLSAENQLYLDQLTFGERVDSPDATKLPVLFAVALLKNRNGEIDINLPIGGSLDDPQFSVGGIVIKVIVNLVTKAVTAPFSLIGSLFGGGGEELSYLDFAPGKTDLSPTAITKLQSIAKALADRPALRLDIKGQADPATDLDGINHSRLNERLRATKAAQLVKAGSSVGDVDLLTIEPGEYQNLLELVYDAEKVADKPRNALGLAKALPIEEMEKLLLSHLAKEAPDLQSLASERARVARDWLVNEGKVGAERIFLVGTEQTGAGKGEGASAPRVSFALK